MEAEEALRILLHASEDGLVSATNSLLLAVCDNESIAKLLNHEGVFTRLLHLISNTRPNEDQSLQGLLLNLLYEIARVQVIAPDELGHVNDAFICQLFALIEHDHSDYPAIGTLLVLNEQYMISTSGLTNKVIKILASQGQKYPSFGQSLIILLNRATETSLQLLSLKLFFLLFETPPTQHYLYTNDVRVLLDILIRNLLDLPSDAAALRHTYLRVLYPLLAHTQLKEPPHYKRDEIKRLLAILAGTQPLQEEGDEGRGNVSWGHFQQADETTLRLINRVRTVAWLQDPADDQIPSLHVGAVGGEKGPPAPPAPRKLQKRNLSKTASGYLAPQLESAGESALSVLEVATQREKPGVITPSKRAALLDPPCKKERPLPPTTRRSTWRRRGRDTDPRRLEQVASDGRSGIPAKEVVHDGDFPETIPLPAEANDGWQLTKKPPPAPKARRWQGKIRKREDEGGGVELPTELPPGPLAPSHPTEKALSGSEPGSADSPLTKAISVDGVSNVLERAHLGPRPAPGRRIVLAPPSPAPPRGVPGPTFSLERSPFIGEGEDD